MILFFMKITILIFLRKLAWYLLWYKLSNIFDIFYLQKTSGLGKLGTSSSGDPHLTVGFIVPHSFFLEREYLKAIKNAVINVNRRKPPFQFSKKYKFNCGESFGRSDGCEDVEMVMLHADPSPQSKLLLLHCLLFWLYFQVLTFTGSYKTRFIKKWNVDEKNLFKIMTMIHVMQVLKKYEQDEIQIDRWLSKEDNYT